MKETSRPEHCGAMEMNLINPSCGTAQSVFEKLTLRGWSLEDSDQMKARIAIQVALSDDMNIATIADEVEAELLDSDLSLIGSASLPEPKILARKFFYLHGPTILQISEAKDIAVPSDSSLSTMNKRRLLRFLLTDGKSNVVAVEFSPIPAIPTDVVPGTKVLLQNKIPIRCGILCLDQKAITILGGVVQALHDEWKMKQRYTNFANSAVKLPKSREEDAPPLFEKLKIEKSTASSSAETFSTAPHASSSKSYPPTSGNGSGFPGSSRNWHRDQKTYIPVEKNMNEHDKQIRAPMRENGKDPEVADNSALEVSALLETVSLQNQEASQKLLQKLSNPNNFPRNRNRSKHKNSQRQYQEFHTLDEWEEMQSREKFPDTSQDENIALQLQSQFDDIDSQVDPNLTADDIKRGMFDYGRQGDHSQVRDYGGRGRRGGGRRGRGSWNKSRGGGRFR